MINSTVLMGRLTKNPEYQAGNTPFTRFTVAVDRVYKQGITDFIPCITFGKTADFVYKYFTKGQMIALEGELHVDKYTTKDGATRSAYTVVANNVSFCGDKNENGNNKANKEPAFDEPQFDEPPLEEDLPF